MGFSSSEAKAPGKVTLFRHGFPGLGEAAWKPRWHAGVNATPPLAECFRRDSPGLPRARGRLRWAACGQGGGRQGPGPSGERRRQGCSGRGPPASWAGGTVTCPQAQASQGWAGLPPACRQAGGGGGRGRKNNRVRPARPAPAPAPFPEPSSRRPPNALWGAGRSPVGPRRARK